MMQESSGGTDKEMNGTQDVMQVNNGVNNFEDYADYKAHYGLSEGVIPDPVTSIQAGVNDLATKGFKDGVQYDSNTGKMTFIFKGWNNALKNINGGGAAKHGQGYVKPINHMISNSRKPNPQDYK